LRKCQGNATGSFAKAKARGRKSDPNSPWATEDELKSNSGGPIEGPPAEIDELQDEVH